MVKVKIVNAYCGGQRVTFQIVDNTVIMRHEYHLADTYLHVGMLELVHWIHGAFDNEMVLSTKNIVKVID